MSPATFTLLVVASLVAQAPATPPEARVLVSSPRAGKLDLFLEDPATGTTKNLTATGDRVELWPAWSADGKRIAVATWMDDVSRQTEITVMASDGSDRKRVATPEDGGSCVCPTWSPDGKHIAYARVFGTPARTELRLVNADGTGDKLLAENAGFPAWSPDGATIAFARMMPEKSRACLATMKPDGTGVVELTEPHADVAMLTPAWSPDGKWIAYPAPVGGSIEIHRISPDGKFHKQLTHLGAGALHPVWLDEEGLMFTCIQPQGASGFLMIRQDGTRMQIHPLSKLEPANPLIRAAVLPPRSYAQLTARASGVRPVSHVEAAPNTAPRLSPIMMFRAGNRIFVDVVWSKDGKSFASAGPDGKISVAEVATDAIRTSFDGEGHTGGSTAVAWAHDGKRLYSTGMDKTLRLWNPPSTEAVAISTMVDAGGSIAVHPEGKCIAVAGMDGVITLRDPESLKVQKSFPFDEKKTVGLLGLVWSKDGRTLYAAGGSGSLVVIGGVVAAFNPDTGETKWRTKATHGTVSTLEISPDGTRLAGACGDTFVRLWDAATGKELHTLKGHTDRVSGVTWAMDNKSLVSCGLDHTLRHWDADSGAALATYSGHIGPAIRAHVRPDGKSVLSTGLDRVLVWKLETP